MLDPAALFAGPPDYLLDVLAWEADEDRWRLIVLEDAGELLGGEHGSALAPLLNLTDGVLGQGTSSLVLVTTNDPPARLRPAVRRPGRCLIDLEFVPFPPTEANAWLEPVPEPPGFGFARALGR